MKTLGQQLIIYLAYQYALPTTQSSKSLKPALVTRFPWYTKLQPKFLVYAEWELFDIKANMSSRLSRLFYLSKIHVQEVFVHLTLQKMSRTAF